MVLCLSYITPMMCSFHGTLEENMWSGKIAIGRAQQIQSLRHRNLFLLLSLSCCNVSIWTMGFGWDVSIVETGLLPLIGKSLNIESGIFEHCFGLEWILSIELPMSWKKRIESSFDFWYFWIVENGLLLLICKRMRMGFWTILQTGVLPLICKCLNFDNVF